MTAKEKAKQIKCYCGHTTYCDCGPLEEPLKETLEEAAKNETKICINEREKQTAVEWLREIYDSCNNYEKFIANIDWEQAKEMEKEKLEQFYNHGQWAVIENGHGECFEDYYNRTFKSE